MPVTSSKRSKDSVLRPVHPRRTSRDRRQAGPTLFTPCGNPPPNRDPLWRLRTEGDSDGGQRSIFIYRVPVQVHVLRTCACASASASASLSKTLHQQPFPPPPPVRVRHVVSLPTLHIETSFTPTAVKPNPDGSQTVKFHTWGWSSGRPAG